MAYRGGEDSKVVTMGMLQSSLDVCLHWCTCLANEIVVHRSQEGFNAHVSASSLHKQQRQRQKTRRKGLQEAQNSLRRGAALAKERDNKKRSYYEMNDDEQKILEDYETGITARSLYDILRSTTPRLKPFRCNVERKD